MKQFSENKVLNIVKVELVSVSKCNFNYIYMIYIYVCHNFRDLKNSCLFALTQTRLTDKLSEKCVSLPVLGISCWWAYRAISNARGGGVCLYVNDRWCEKEKDQ